MMPNSTGAEKFFAHMTFKASGGGRQTNGAGHRGQSRSNGCRDSRARRCGTRPRNFCRGCLIRITRATIMGIAFQSTDKADFLHFLLTLREHLVNFPQMEAQKATAAPSRFIHTLKDAMDMKGFSLRQLADKVGVSPAYLSRLFNRERGVPADDTIAKFEEILDIQPRGALFDSARRDDQIAVSFKKITGARLLMQTLAPLTEAEMLEVQKVAQQLAKKHAKVAR